MCVLWGKGATGIGMPGFCSWGFSDSSNVTAHSTSAAVRRESYSLDFSFLPISIAWYLPCQRFVLLPGLFLLCSFTCLMPTFPSVLLIHSHKVQNKTSKYEAPPLLNPSLCLCLSFCKFSGWVSLPLLLLLLHLPFVSSDSAEL